MIAVLSTLAAASGTILAGLMITIGTSLAAVLSGTVLGFAFGLVLTYGGWSGALPVRFIVDVVRGTPVLVLILACYYMPAGFGISPGPITAGIAALSIFCAAHMGET